MIILKISFLPEANDVLTKLQTRKTKFKVVFQNEETSQVFICFLAAESRLGRTKFATHLEAYIYITRGAKVITVWKLSKSEKFENWVIATIYEKVDGRFGVRWGSLKISRPKLTVVTQSHKTRAIIIRRNNVSTCSARVTFVLMPQRITIHFFLPWSPLHTTVYVYVYKTTERRVIYTQVYKSRYEVCRTQSRIERVLL